MNRKYWITLTTLTLLGAGLTGCTTAGQSSNGTDTPNAAEPNAVPATTACVEGVCTAKTRTGTVTMSDDIPLMEACADGVCTAQPKAPKPTGRKPLWADSHLWRPAPELEVGEWLTEQPELEGKFVMIEFWRTWCSSCKRQTLLMNKLQEQFKDDLVIIAITGQTKEAIDAYNGPKKNYYMAIDKPNQTPPPAAAEEIYQEVDEVESGRGAPDVLPEGSHIETEQGEYEAQFGVYGWPHVVLLEPTEHVVIWEGFPAAKGFELTAEKLGRYIERGKAASQ